jgi:hypothetical protein
MNENRFRSVFGTSKDESGQESCRQSAEEQVRDLTIEEYQEEQREEARKVLESELRKTPEQRADEFKEWSKRWFSATKEKERKVIDNLLKPRRIKWPNR